VTENTWAVANANTQRMECKRCGATEPLPIGLLLNQAADVFGGFARRHDDCPSPNEVKG
jgi:hypothetical protein